MFVAVCSDNVNAMLTVVFLDHFYQILHRYLVKPKDNVILDKDTVIDNINIIFELLDECMDFGIVQQTDYNLLKEYIKVEINLPRLTSIDDDDDEEEEEEEVQNKKRGKKHGKRKLKDGKSRSKTITSTKNMPIKKDVIAKQDEYINSSILKTASLAINWRPKGVFYVKNEIYLDIVENCHFYYDLQSDTIKLNEVFGTCSARCYLSGMPQCKLGFNEENISGIDKSEIIPRKQDDNNLLHNEDDNDEEEDEEVSLASDDKNDDKNDGETRQKLHNRIPIRNIQFHQCVELSSVYEDNLLRFVPPDDSFVLMTYNVEQQKQRRKLPLIMIKPIFRINHEARKLQILCVLNTNFKRRLRCVDLLIKIPIDPNLFDIAENFGPEDLKYKSELGDVSFKIDSSELFWRFDDINGRKTVKMMAEIPLNNVGNITLETIDNFMYNKIDNTTKNSNDGEQDDDEDDEDDSLDKFYGVNGKTGSLVHSVLKHAREKQGYNNILVSFQIPQLTYSGIKINYLTVDEEQMKYTCFPWVKYLTQSPGNVEQATAHNCIYRFKLGPRCFQIQ
jgi:hypothetical protein